MLTIEARKLSCFSNSRILELPQIVRRGWLRGFCKYFFILQDPCSTPTTPSHIAYMCLWLVLLIITVSSNFTVIMAIYRISYLRENAGNFFIASLALSDMLIGLFILPVRMKVKLVYSPGRSGTFFHGRCMLASKLNNKMERKSENSAFLPLPLPLFLFLKSFPIIPHPLNTKEFEKKF